MTESEPTRKSRGFDSNASVDNLQQKLKSAAKHIAQLAKERQQLIEICNRLRADLKKAGQLIMAEGDERLNGGLQPS